MKHASKVLFALMLVLLLALTACNKTDSDAKPKDEGKKTEEGKKENAKGEEQLYSIDDFSNIKTNEGEAMEGGSFTFGLVSDTAFQGTLNFNFYSGDPDAQVLEWFDEGMLTWDENYVYTNDGAATYEASEDGKTFTFKIRDNVNWHDGEPVTAEDWLFAHEVIANKDYDGPRFDSTLRNVVGIEDYHEGKADTISGIEVVDEKTLKITYIEATPSLITGGIWTYPLAKHIFGDMPVKDISSSPEVRENPIGFGPFKVESIVPGESVTYTKNEDYWRGAPKLDKVTLKVINPNVVVQSLKKGEVDTVDKFPVDQFPANAELSNVEYLGAIDRAYSYIGFKLGTWDKKAKEVKTDPNAKMADVNLRKAMWHAVDNNAVGDRFYHGLRWAATTLIPASHPEYHDESNPGAPYDPEKAKQILEDAGYKDVDGDGIREDKEGNELVINFASMSGDEVAEPLAKYYIQAWEAVGLKVELLDGRLQEFNSFYEGVGEKGDDNPDIDIYAAAWGVGIDVDPSGLYGRDAIYNFTRWSSEENDRLLAEGISEAAFDPEKRKEIYKEWQQLMTDEVPVFPTLYRSVLVPVNNRVHNYAIGDGTGMYKNEIEVTQEEPLAEK
ncbi:oligopeptide ABC transporter substrate-binding protein [Lederbergia lenta]|uniref:oligopeptide ABC transporter substrate-binding protein n=1 Tax=Lederbergia lenta TaxID=1467 RepID=UPI00203BD8D3|nr:oligopeptide ABC transporter substrate-binding protein [Lederbergia lenta]MCM3112992.1 oligopeptide ABC transporter substrate-binding protein [Lederbergia lenta]